MTRRLPPKKPVPRGQHVQGYLWCRVCSKAWHFSGTSDATTWPQHRCGWDVAPFQEFLLEDPRTSPLPKGKGAKLAHD